MTEAVRLVIWDLDDTFWRGTISEGAIEYRQDLHDCVIELAQRGIMSSICSKNDHETIRDYLTERGVWDYFIFPSINWEPKGQRVQAIIDAVQLRPASILFIDDNPGNINEALHYVPELQVAAEADAAAILSDPLFKGKNDSGLSRLKQYKILEQRKADEIAAGSDNREFLRSSGIKVTIDHDVPANIDRAVELVNRTNQLNFTKSRLSEIPEIAAAELIALVSRYNVQSGLISVRDNYGDYGVCGFYAIKTLGSESTLIHYCFSCRILNMGVEAWVYDLIGKPKLTVVGDVLTDIHAQEETPDWINVDAAETEARRAIKSDLVATRGGCNLTSLSHYFSTGGARTVGEFNIQRNGLDVRRDHSIFLRYAIAGTTEEQQRELTRMGFDAEDYNLGLFNPSDQPVWLLSFWADADFPVYKHKTLDLYVPFNLQFPGRPGNLTETEFSALPKHLQTDWMADTLKHFAANYEYVGLTPREIFEENLRMLLDRAPHEALVYVLGNNEYRKTPDDPKILMSWKKSANDRTKEVLSRYTNAHFLDVHDFIKSDEEVENDPNHFNRIVYFRIYEHIYADVGNIRSAAGLNAAE